jgi:cytochrome c oxidase assembly protein subunit 15
MGDKIAAGETRGPNTMDAVITGPAGGGRAGQGCMAVRIWLLGIAGLVFAMILVGGATRLTESGLSITEWQPLLGALPPMSEAAWDEAFRKYREIPQYTIINRGMTLDEFKAIYWWEWGHRLLGRFIGVALLVPFLWLWAGRRIAPALMPHVVAIFALGGLQGALGWYMVMSGLVDRVDVSQYRLAAHLGLALLIFGYVFWLALDLDRIARREPRRQSVGPLSGAVALVASIFVQMLLGALVAGLDAGRGYNTWPLMDGRVIPEGLFVDSPWWINLFENAMTVQFDHRMVAYGVLAVAAAQTFRVFASGAGDRAGTSASMLLAALVAQAGLGIWTLLAQVPIDLGLAHQGGAVVVFAVALWHVHDLYRPAEIVGLAASPRPAG